MAYLVLGNCYRGYLVLGDMPKPSMDNAQPIGSSAPKGSREPWGNLMIHGSDVANVYFETEPTPLIIDQEGEKTVGDELKLRLASGEHVAVSANPNDHPGHSN
jgi:hypothetical protein